MIIGVAIKSENVTISLPKPNRHGHCFVFCAEVLGIKPVKHLIGNKSGAQGFITDKGVYLNREQAMRHVKRCKQKLIPDRQDGQVNKSKYLFSEDLW